MKTEQLQLILEIEKEKSISKAAQNLFMAQPNASHSLNALESELGFKILDRSPNGVSFTEKGKKFLQYAHIIQRNFENIHMIHSETGRVRLSVATYAYPFSENAFIRFCKRNLNSAETLRCSLKIIGTVQEGVDALTDNQADLSLVVCRKELYGQNESLFRQHGLLPTILGDTSLYVTMSQRHPLVSKDPLNLSDYQKYPCISNAGAAKGWGSSEVDTLLGSINLHIVLEPNTSRLLLLKDTNCFSVTTPYQQQILKQYGLVSKLIPNTDRYITVLVKEEYGNTKEISKYLDILSEEFRRWQQNI